MAALGSFILLATFVVASYAVAASVAGGRRRSQPLIDSGVGAFYLTAALMSVASVIIVHAFVTGNFAIRYVQRYSDAAQPMASQDHVDAGRARRLDHVLGLPAVGVRHGGRRGEPRAPPRADSWVVAVISVVEMFFIFIMVVHNNPFSTFVTSTPADGRA